MQLPENGRFVLFGETEELILVLLELNLFSVLVYFPNQKKSPLFTSPVIGRYYVLGQFSQVIVWKGRSGEISLFKMAKLKLNSLVTAFKVPFRGIQIISYLDLSIHPNISAFLA